jgi:hypothetical protein
MRNLRPLLGVTQPRRPAGARSRCIFAGRSGAVVLGVLSLTCCSVSGGGTQAPTTSGGASSGGASAVVDGGNVGGGFVVTDAQSDARTVTILQDAAPTRCNDAGECRCIAIANVGKVGNTAPTNAYDNWLNTKSNASVANVPQRVVLDEGFLAQYDILIFQDVSTWQVSDAEVRSIETWVRKGGGVMSMQGYGAFETEVETINKVLAPFKLAYNKAPAGAGTMTLTTPITDWNPASPISAHMSGYAVRVINGRPVIDQDGTGVLTATGVGNADGQTETFLLGYTKSIDDGHVFAWADEWVTYTSEWDTSGNLRVEQFWYNTIKYLTPPDICKVRIDSPGVIMF